VLQLVRSDRLQRKKKNAPQLKKKKLRALREGLSRQGYLQTPSSVQERRSLFLFF
jgi:hypothetical protein